eukprot:785004-Amphidinium_carterae.4
MQYWSCRSVLNPTHHTAWDSVEEHLQLVPPSTSTLIHEESRTAQKRAFWRAVESWACAALNVHPMAARAFHGCRQLKGLPPYAAALTVWWFIGKQHSLQFTDCLSSELDMDSELMASNHWRNTCGVQLLFATDDADYHQKGAPVGSVPAAQIEDRDEAMSSAPSTRGRLSTIPEEGSIDRDSTTPGENMFLVPGRTCAFLDTVIPCPNAEGVMSHYLCDDVTLRCDETTGGAIDRAPKTLQDGQLELLFAGNAQLMLQGVDKTMQGFLVLRCQPAGGSQGWSYHEGLAGSQQRLNVERDDDILTASELEEHSDLVKAEMKDELERWCVEFKVCERRSRASATNVIDIRWVVRWKYKLGTDGIRRRGLRARLTVRGFKDMSPSNDVFSATASRLAQRIVVSESMMHDDWQLAGVDIRKAFLQGVTYAELAKETSSPMKEVNFEVPPGTVGILRTIEGYHDYDPKLEVLGLLKPGTGLRDAPRAFQVKLRQSTARFGWISSIVDPELEYLRDSGGSLVGVLSKHVDDIKLASTPEVRQKFVEHLKMTFGQPDMEVTTFCNCGVNHTLSQDMKTRRLDQFKFIAAIKRCPLAGKSDHELPEHERRQFLSSLMTLAYATLTRVDILPFVTALQRACSHPTYLHVHRLNKLIQYVQKNPKTIDYVALPGGFLDRVVVYSDSAFAAEGANARSQRGCVVLRVRTADWPPTPGVAVQCHLIDWSCTSQRKVTRSTYSSELFAATDAVDSGILVREILREMHTGQVGPEWAKHACESPAAVPVKMSVLIDAQSVYDSICSPHSRVPAEKSQLLNVAWLRELVANGTIHSLEWVDTRDMIADGLTKGCIQRDALDGVMSGKVEMQHPCKSMSLSKLGKASSP